MIITGLKDVSTKDKIVGGILLVVAVILGYAAIVVFLAIGSWEYGF